ncbi:MAG: efflux RND transporter periplasmic adaptor subunit [Gemmatimonas sp.]|nr:efflux RND transporter periplasmic adaptor subunit [Gemmatimonas sp.]
MSAISRYQPFGRQTFAAVILALMSLPGCSDNGESAAVAEAEHTDAEAHDVVLLDSTAIAIANIALVPVAAVRTTGLPVTGIITFDANRVSHIGPRIDGRIVRLTADIGERVQGGQGLAILESADVGQVRADEAEAEALVGIAQENYQRELRLEEQGISSRKELLDAEAELRRAEAALNSARQRLQVLGAGQGQGGQFALAAPFPGTIVERHASLGEMASPADQLFTVANLDRLWIELDIYERDLARVARGQAVDVTTAAYPGRTFPGVIVYVGDIVDPERRTVRARVEIPNADTSLKPGMFANALIRVGGEGPPVPAVPREAVQEVEGRTVVFVPGSRPGEFRAQPIQVGEPTEDGMVLVQSGLGLGDRVVTTGAFALRSEVAEGDIGEAGHGH